MQVWKFDLASKRISKETAPTVGTAVHNDLLTDTLYLVSGTAVLGMAIGTIATGKWRGKLIKVPSGGRVGFAWLRLNGQLNLGATVRLYAEGTLFYTTPLITDREPVRLPAGQYRSWEIEIESKDRITSLAIASTTSELL